MYDESANVQSLKIEKIWITQMYQPDPLSFSADLRMEEEKEKGGCGICQGVLYFYLFEPQFPACLAAISAETQQEKVIGSQTFLETFHCKFCELTGMQSRLGASVAPLLPSCKQNRLQAPVPVPGHQQPAGSPFTSIPQEPHLEVTRRWTSCCCTASLSSGHHLGEEKSYLYSPQ